LFHDIGKTDPIFQKYIHDKTTTSFNPNGVHIEKVDKKEKFSFENHPRHNEVSWLIIEELMDRKDFKMNKVFFEILKNVVL
jgi:CRISPR-associated endonuclease/helicase Cas3